MFVVIKNGLIHNCRTEERYKSFKASGWEDYNPEKKKPASKKADSGKDK